MLADRSSIAVVGPGGVGGLVGALLTRAGHEVVFVARPETADRLDDHDLVVRSEQFESFHVRAVASPVLDRDVDVCIVAVKAPALGAALERVDPERVRSVVLPLLNGVDHMEPVRAWFGPQKTAAGAIRVEAARTAPTLIEHYTSFVDIRMGSREIDLQPLVDQFSRAGLTATASDEPERVLWDKLVFLAPFALATTAHDSSIGPVRTNHRSDLSSLVAEAAAVGRAHGASLSADDVMAFVDSVPESMSSSLRRDVSEGLEDELDAIGGAITRWARSASMPVPVTTTYVERVASLRTARGRASQ